MNAIFKQLYIVLLISFFVCLPFVFRFNGGRDILDTFIKSGLHPNRREWVEWPKETIIVCKIDFSDDSKKIVIKRNESKTRHAELVLLEDSTLSDEAVTTIQRITIYINYSPCTDCGIKLMELKLKLKIPDLQIIFSSLYKIKRPSCEESSCSPKCKAADNHAAVTTLKKLNARPFQNEDWDDLIILLKEYNASRLDSLRLDYIVWRKTEDEKMMKDYEILIGPGTSDQNTSSTKESSSQSEGDQEGTLSDEFKGLKVDAKTDHE